MNEHLSSDPFESLEDEIASLNFGLQDDISIKKSEIEFYQLVLQICKEYNLEVDLQQYPISLGVDSYTSFISIFSKTFVLDEDIHRKLYFANRLMYIYTIYMDGILDGQEEIKVDAYFLVSLLKDQAYVLLNSLFPQSSDFWTFSKNYQRRFIAATLEERKKWNTLTSYSLDEAFKIASGKAATAQMATTALACLSDSTELIGPFEKSLDAFFTAVQFRDDLKDWRVDL